MRHHWNSCFGCADFTIEVSTAKTLLQDIFQGVGNLAPGVIILEIVSLRVIELKTLCGVIFNIIYFGFPLPDQEGMYSKPPSPISRVCG